MNNTLDVCPQLMEPLSDGLPRVSVYNEFLRVMELEDTPDNLIIWSRTFYLLMSPWAGEEAGGMM